MNSVIQLRLKKTEHVTTGMVIHGDDWLLEGGECHHQKEALEVTCQGLLSGCSRMLHALLSETIDHPHEIKCMHGSEYIVMHHVDVELIGELNKKNR